MSTTIVPPRGLPPVETALVHRRSQWTDRTTSWFLAVLLVFGMFLPTSVDGKLRPVADVAIACLATLTNGVMLLHWRRFLRPFDVVLTCFGVGALLLATLTSPYYGSFSFGVTPFMTALFCMLLVRPPAHVRARVHRTLDRAVTAASWILVVWGVGVVGSSAAVQQFTIRFFPAFYDDLVRFMVIEVRHPVGPFGTHSTAAFWYFLLFLIAYRRFLTTRRLRSFALAASLLVLIVALRSFSALFLGAAALAILLVPSVAFRPPSSRAARHRWRRAVSLCWLGLVVGLLAELDTIVGYANSIFGVQFGGFSGRYSLSSGRIFRTIQYLQQHPLRPIGITKSSDLVFGDAGLIEFYLRGGLVLLVCVYALYGMMLFACGFRGRLWWVLFAGLFAFDLGFTALTLARLQLVLIPVLLALQSAGRPSVAHGRQPSRVLGDPKNQQQREVPVMEETFEPFAKRWLAGLGRLWWVVVATVAAGVVASILVSSSSYTLTTRFLLVDNTVPLVTADLKPDDFLRSVSFKTAAQGISSLEAKAAVSKAVGQSVEVEVAPDEAQRVMNVVVRGPSKSAVERGRDALLQRLIDTRSSDVGAVIAAGKKTLDERVAATTRRIDEIDTALKALPAGSSAFGDSLRVERTKRGDDLVDAASATKALDEWLAGVPSGVQELPGNGAVPGSPVLGGLLGVVGGFVVGAGIIALVVLLDRRVRSRADLRRVGYDRVIGVVRTADGRQHDVSALRLVVGRLATEGHSTSVQVVGVDRSAQADRLVADLQGVPSSDDVSIVARTALSEGVDALEHARDDAATVVVVGAGRTRPEDVIEAVRNLSFSGANVLGVVLDGVNQRERRAAVS